MLLDIMGISLTQGLYALVDSEDYERLVKHKWYALKTEQTYYAVRQVQVRGTKNAIYMHREILSLKEEAECDHKNHSGLDNRRQNLRICTHAQNMQNQKAIRGGTSKYKGVRWSKGICKWRTRITQNDKFIHLGYFVNEKEAAKAYDKKAKELFGEFANLNFKE